jgi:putative DNA primase/helicase
MTDQVQPENIARIKEQVAARQCEEAENIPQQADETSSIGGPDDPRFVLQCLDHNEQGDGVLYASLHRDRLTYDKTDHNWIVFPAGAHHWQLDEMGEAINAVEDVAQKYQAEADKLTYEINNLTEEHEAALDRKAATKDEAAKDLAGRDAARLENQIDRYQKKRKALGDRVRRLRGETGAKKCLFWAHHGQAPLAIIGRKKIDQKPMLFPVANGVIDLELGTLRAGSPHDWLVKSSPLDFPSGVGHYLATGDDCPCPGFDKFTREILGDDEIAAFWQRLLGYCLTGLSHEHILTVAIGEGRNGKGTTFELLKDILGDFAWVISPELILEQKNARSSSGATADLMALHNRRFLIGSETDENRRISGAAAKQLSGGDTIKARALYQAEEVNIHQTWKLFLQTNTIPQGLTKDFAILQRLVYVKFPFLFVDDPAAEARIKPALVDQFRLKDRALPQRLAREAPGILAWLVRGCLLWQKHGLAIPDKIKADVDQLRIDEDVLGQYIENCCDRDPEYSCAFKVFFEGYEKYHKENVGGQDRYIPTKKRIAADMVKRGYRKETIGGSVKLYGIRPLDQDYYA